MVQRGANLGSCWDIKLFFINIFVRVSLVYYWCDSYLLKHYYTADHSFFLIAVAQ